MASRSVSSGLSVTTSVVMMSRSCSIAPLLVAGPAATPNAPMVEDHGRGPRRAAAPYTGARRGVCRGTEDRVAARRAVTRGTARRRTVPLLLPADRDLASARRRLRRLGHADGEHALVEVRLDLLRVHREIGRAHV